MTAVVGSGVLAQAIGTAFNGKNETVWLSSTIGIMIAVLSPAVSQLADLWGRKWVLVLCAFTSCVGSIVASRAQSMGTVIAGFTIIGLGCGSQSTLHAVASEVVPRSKRPLAQATVNIGNLIGTILALCMGSALLRGDNVNNYRVFMYITAGIFALATCGLTFGYKPPPRELQVVLSNSEKLGRLDWLGFLLFTPGLVLFCVGLSWSRNPYPWSDARVSATFVVGVCLILSFAIYEWRFKKDGFLHHDLFKKRNFALGALTVFAEGLSFFAANSFYAYEIAVFIGADLFNSALHYLITFVTAVVAAVVAGLYMTKTRTVRVPTTLGNTMILVFLICMATTTPSTPAGVFWGFPVILGAGFGVILPSVLVAVQLSTPPDMIAMASALVISFRALGATVGLAINNALFNDSLARNIPKKIGAAVTPLGFPQSSLGALIAAITGPNPSAVTSVPGVTPQIINAAGHALTEAFGVAFRNAWIASACFIFTAILSKLCQTPPGS